MSEDRMVYLDNSATTRQYDEVTEMMVRCMKEDYGNPSSMHRMGVKAEKILREARQKVAASLGASPDEIIFTSGGTESDNTAFESAVAAGKRKGRKIITTCVEHPAVLEECRRLEKRGYEVVYLSVDGECRVNMDEYRASLSEDVILVSVMTVNNEVGTVQPVEEMYRMKPEGTLFHTDAVQAYGKMEIPKVDMISISGHKIHGPKGIGALYVKKGVKFTPFIVGGGQERAMRSGTENLPAIAGLGAAAEISCSSIGDGYTAELRKVLAEGLLAEVKDIRINSPEDGIGNILNVSFLGTKSEVILHKLEESGIYVSAGSACSSHKKGGSHVLQAMGLKHDQVESAIRFSLSGLNTVDDMEYTVDRVKKAVESFRMLGRFR